MKKWVVIVIIISVVVIGTSVWYWRFGKSLTPVSSTSSADPDLATLKGPHILYTVSATSIGNYIPLVGVVSANVYNIDSLVSGQVTNVYVQQGQLVRKGQLLINIGHLQYKLNYQQALNNYYKALLNRDASSVVLQYKLALQVAEQNLKYTTITSPATGFIENLNVATGDFVNVRQNTVTIIQSTGMWINAYVNEVDLADVHVGQKAIITFTQLNDLKLEGKVSFVQPFATTQSGLTVIPIRIAFDKNPLKYGVVYGLDCNIDLELGSSNGIMIPLQAIFTDKNGHKYVLLKTPNGYKRVQVTIGKQIGMMIEIVKGIKRGDVLIMRVPSQFRETGNPFRKVFKERRRR